MLTLDRTTFDRVNRDGPDWVRDLRSRAFDLFDGLPMPSPKEEIWRYVELDFDLADFRLPDEPGSPAPADAAVQDALGDLAGRAQVVDGFTVEAEHDARHGVVFASLAQAGDDAGLRAAVESGVGPETDRFSAAHHAFRRDGVFLHVPAGTSIADPFFVDVQATTAGTVTLPQLTVVVGDDAEASVVVLLRSPDAARLLVVPQVVAQVGDAGRLRLTTVQEWGDETLAMAHQRLRAGRDAGVRFGEVGLGGVHSRLHLRVDLAGRGSSANISGVYFGDRRQVHDYRYFMTHAAPNTNSDMFLKGAVEDEADSVFTGLIRIEEEAQRTNAYQTNRNLVLSDGARAHSVPNLEILANDVKCGHGSTVGPLDEEQRYYLMSRGLDEVRADRLQVRGFFEEAIRRLPHAALADPVRERVNAKFVAAQEEGRV